MMQTTACRDIERRFAAARLAAEEPCEETDQPELAMLDAVGSVMTLDRETTLFHEGDTAHYYYKVVSGAVRSCRLLTDGRRHVGDFFLPGDLIGFHSLEIHGFTAEAVNESTLVRYERRRVEALMARSPRVGKCLLNRMCSELSEARSRMVMLGRMTAQERIANFLLRMADRGGRAEPDSITLPMTRTDIGDYLGLTTETVCRTLAQLKSAGVIEAPSPHNVRLLQRATLARLAQGV
jgi:CRP-like cAMP-binding protein